MTTSSRPLFALSSWSIAVGLAAVVATSASGVQDSTSSGDHRQRLEELAQRVEHAYVIGPKAAGELGFRVGWQATMTLPPNGHLKQIEVSDEVLFAVDNTNSVSRLRASDGEQVWRVAVANPVDIFRGIHWLDVPVTTGVGRNARTTLEKQVYISTDTECFVLSGDSGSLLGRQRYVKLPTTKPVVSGRYFIYGTGGGQIVFHHYMIGEEWRANALTGTIRGQLVRAPDAIVATSDRGDVMVVDDDTASRRWDRSTFGPIVTAAAVGAGEVFVASTDQYLWAFDLANGDVLWRYFTESPLKTPPFAFDNAVLQFVPTEGLVCLEARGTSVDGTVRWTNKDAIGVPIGLIGDRIALWNQDGRTLTLVDPGKGAVVSSTHLPQVDTLTLVTEGALAGDIIATNRDGRVVRLMPKVQAMPPADVNSDAPAADAGAIGMN